MKNFVLAIVLGSLSTQAIALSGTTKGGYAACLKKQWAHDLTRFVVAKDKDNFKSYIDSKKCIILRKGLRVTVTESPGVFGGTAGFVVKVIKFWAAREALKYGN